MINLNNVIKFCPNNYTEIENYDKAINDNSQMWYCHHRNGEEFSRDWLIKNNMYYNRTDPHEFKFVTKSEHERIHSRLKNGFGRTKVITEAMRKAYAEGGKIGMKNKKHTEDTKAKMRANKDNTRIYLAERTIAWKEYKSIHSDANYRIFIKNYRKEWRI